ncbi:hypothetical protein FI667_g13695, partial [Globisporangium splendens]
MTLSGNLGGSSVEVSTYGANTNCSQTTANADVQELRMQLQVHPPLSLRTCALYLDLQQARAEITRFASRVRRLQQEAALLERKHDQRGIAGDASSSQSSSSSSSDGVTRANTEDADSNQSEREQQVDDADGACDAWSNVLRDVVKNIERKCLACNSSHCARRDKSAVTKLDGLRQFLQQQQQLVLALGRENSQLRDQLEARPTRRQLDASLFIHTLRNLKSSTFKSRFESFDPKRSTRQQQPEFDHKGTTVSSASYEHTHGTDRDRQIARLYSRRDKKHSCYTRQEWEAAKIDAASFSERSAVAAVLPGTGFNSFFG